jgi:hypothetical protein
VLFQSSPGLRVGRNVCCHAGKTTGTDTLNPQNLEQLTHNRASLYGLWITLIKLSYTPLRGDLSGPDIHEAE